MEFKDLTLTTGTLRAFVPANEYSLERAFYSDLGFKEFYINDTLTILKIGDFSFYLQNYWAPLLSPFMVKTIFIRKFIQ